MTAPRMVVGCMSGTSMDGIDAALVLIEGKGLGQRASVARAYSGPMPYADELRAFAEGCALSARALRSISLDLGNAHRALIAELLRGDSADLIVLHGQTVLHDPPLSWQLVDPWPAAEAFGCPIVSDLRSRNIVAGGQGAPLTPIADWVLFRDAREPRTLINLGGFANFTRIPVASSNHAADLTLIRGGDIGACNLVLDRLARLRLGEPFDTDGRAAQSGTVSEPLAAEFAQRLCSEASRSLGTGDEATWIDDATAQLSAADALATACDAIARAIAARLEPGVAVIAGGGVRNRALTNALKHHHDDRICMSDDFGIPAQFREAAGFAVLGALAEDGVPVSLPHITGAATTGRDGQWILP